MVGAALLVTGGIFLLWLAYHVHVERRIAAGGVPVWLEFVLGLGGSALTVWAMTTASSLADQAFR